MNFTYLSHSADLSSLHTCCRECERFVRSSPDISITAARKAIEYMVKLLYGTRICPDIRGLTMFDMLSDYDFITYINSKTLMDAIHTIRKKGNQAVHEGNMTQEDSLFVLEKLHHVTGEICIRLGVITTYPPFDPTPEPAASTADAAAVGTDEPEVDEALIRRLSELARGRMRPSTHAQTDKALVDVHVPRPKTRDSQTAQKRTKGIDSGANGKAAYQYLAGYITQQLPDVQILMESVKSELILIHDGKEHVLVIKTGCTNLGTKDYLGNWKILPNVDHVLYAPDVTADRPIEEQFRLFERDEFLRFWEDLGLLRRKISTATHKRLAETFPPGEKIPTNEYADTICIQSFTNSGRKYPLVMQGLAKFPLLSETALNCIL